MIAREAIDRLIADVLGTCGVVIHDPATPERTSVNDDVQFEAASLIKLPILWHFFQECKAGRVEPDDLVTIPDEITADVREKHGFGVLQILRPGVRMRLRDLAALMIVVSDNTATNILIALLGREKIQATIDELELHETKLQRNMCEYAKRGDPEKDNFTSPRDVAAMLDKFLAPDPSSPFKEEMLDILKGQQCRNKLRTGIPDEIPLAHKTGDLPGVEHDAGIVFLDGRKVIVVVMTQELQFNAQGEELCRRIGNTVYQHFSEQAVLDIQRPKDLRGRMLTQLQARRVDAGQYFDDEQMVEEWDGLFHHHPQRDPPNLSILDRIHGPVTVVDLGPGNGDPLVMVAASIRDRIEKIVLVDTSRAMLRRATKRIQNAGYRNIQPIAADFLRDADALRCDLQAIGGTQLVMCLGGTVGNFRQAVVLPALRSLIADGSFLLLGIAFYEDDTWKADLQEASNFYVSDTNLRFGLQWLKTCKGTPDYGNVSAMIDTDHEELGVKVVRVFYRFPADTPLRVGDEAITIPGGEQIQFIEARRYHSDLASALLAKYGLQLVASSRLEHRGLLLCNRGSLA